MLGHVQEWSPNWRVYVYTLFIASVHICIHPISSALPPDDVTSDGNKQIRGRCALSPLGEANHYTNTE